MKIEDQTEAIRIWAVSGLYYPNFGGAAVQAHEVYRKLLDHGFTVTVLTAAQGKAGDLAGREINRHGITVRYLSTFLKKELEAGGKGKNVKKRMRGYLSTVVFNIRVAWHLWRNGTPGDIVQIDAPSVMSFVPVAVSRLKRMYPNLQMTLLHSDDPMAILSHRHWLFRFLSMRGFVWASSTTGYSSAQFESYRSAGLNMSKVKCIPCGVDLNKFSPSNATERRHLRRSLGFNPNARIILFVGSTILRKGIDIAIRAFIEVHKEMPNTELLLVGPCNSSDISNSEDIQQLETLKRELEAYEFSSYVHWVGRKDNVEDYMQAADVFFFPTRREGFGIVIIEAMATGLPVITSQLEGVTTDIIRSENEGFLVAGRELTDYVEALTQVLNNPDLQTEMGKIARKRTEAAFSLETVAAEYADFFRKVARRV